MKTAIVTGASGNLGEAVVARLRDEKFRIIGTVTREPRDEPADPMIETVAVDLTNEAAATRLVEWVAKEHGAIDVAVLTVGGFAMGKIADTDAASILQQYQLNFMTAYQVARPVFIQMMKQGRGKIFLVGSKPGLDMKAAKGAVAYGLAKSLIFRLAELMNAEAAGTNVITSVIVPSTIDTPQNRASMPDADHDKWVKPEAIADLIAWYCSEKAEPLREPILKVYGGA